jgi:hypothetical protein
MKIKFAAGADTFLAGLALFTKGPMNKSGG